VYKDLAKWLIAFIPVTTLASVGLALGPNADTIANVGLADWVAERPIAVTAVGAVVLTTVGLVALCARVLLAQPSEWTELASDPEWMSEAFSRYSAGRPDFLDATAFRSAEINCLADPGDVRRTAVAETTLRVVNLSGDLNAKALAQKFLWAYLVGIVVIAAGVFTVLVSAGGEPSTITSPASATVHIPHDERARFTSATGCSMPSKVAAVAVAGSWTEPRLRLFGEGCDDDEWQPSPSLHVVVTKN
jgi:hypothetical protein